MRKMFVIFAAALCCSTVAQGRSKAAAASSTVLVDSGMITASQALTCTAFKNILSTTIETELGKDLFIGVSAQTGLFTSSSQMGSPAVTTLENTGIFVRVMVDTAPATPVNPAMGSMGALAFDNLIRKTTLMTPATAIDALSLVLNEGGVRSFNFIMLGLAQGVHTVTVQSRFCTENSLPGTSMSSVQAVIGPRTRTVEQVEIEVEN